MAAFVLAAILVPARVVAAQSPERATDTGTPPWMTAWSPLAPIADHPRRLPKAPLLPQLHLAASPRVGLFWTSGNPAALAFEVSARWSELHASFSSDRGTYRRPLDPDDVEAIQFSALAWQRVGGKSAAAGRIIADRQNLGNASFADFVDPYSSNPLVIADTSAPEMRWLRARLEGAYGLRLRGWGLGLAAGIEVRDNRTEAARFPRDGRFSTYGAAVGVVREVPFADLRVAGYVRWLGGNEAVELLARPGLGLVYRIEGYAEPTPIAVAPPQILFFRRIERHATALGLGVTGKVWGTTWSAVWQRTHRDEAHFSQLRRDPPEDRWEADGRVLGGSLQRPFFADKLLLTAEVHHSRLEGEATRADLEGTIFEAEENALALAADARFFAPPWTVAARYALGREWRRRTDFIAEIGSEIETWSPGVAFEVARAFGNRTLTSVGFALAAYSTDSAIPNPEAMGPLYGTLVAPELSLYATQARPAAVTVALRQGIGTRTALSVLTSWETLTSTGSGSLPFAPNGDRTLWSVRIGVTMIG